MTSWAAKKHIFEGGGMSTATKRAVGDQAGGSGQSSGGGTGHSIATGVAGTGGGGGCCGAGGSASVVVWGIHLVHLWAVATASSQEWMEQLGRWGWWYCCCALLCLSLGGGVQGRDEQSCRGRGGVMLEGCGVSSHAAGGVDRQAGRRQVGCRTGGGKRRAVRVSGVVQVGCAHVCSAGWGLSMGFMPCYAGVFDWGRGGGLQGQRVSTQAAAARAVGERGGGDCRKGAGTGRQW